MKPKIKEVVTKQTKKTWDYGQYKLIEEFKNDKLINQYFVAKKPKNSHPHSYSQKSMRFYYYEDTSPFIGLQTSYEIEGSIPEPTVIDEPENFDKFENCICFWLGMDGWIWRLNSVYPAPCKKTKDYVSGFTNKDFDLNKIKPIIERKTWVESCIIEDIPYYNRDDDKDNALLITLNLDEKIIKKVFDKSKINSIDDEFGIYSVLDNGMDIYGIKKHYKGD